jgi:membrane associated rhomboid family serine protease
MDDGSLVEERAVRSTASATKASDWTLVLTAAGIPHRVDETRGPRSSSAGPSPSREVRNPSEGSESDERGPRSSSAGPSPSREVRNPSEGSESDERGPRSSSAGPSPSREVRNPSEGSESADGRFTIVVAAADEARATEALDGFDAEGAAEAPPPAPDRGPSLLGLEAAIAFGLVTGPRAAGSRWFDVGSASAELIWRGAWWRAITALTLHADLLHLAGNFVACLIFISAVGRWLGAGVGAVLILASAMAANLLTAAAHRTAFVSVGSSTATFAALGLCAGLQMVRRLRLRARRGYAWVPLGAGLALYAMLGVGPDADTYAHLFGLGVGAVVGLGAAYAQIARGWRPPRPIVQALLGMAALGAIALAWWLAFRARG